MKVIATNIFDFTTFYKFGFKPVAKASVIDLSDLTLTGKELLSKTGFFEEEYEVFYLEVNDNFLSANGDLVNLSLFDVDFIVPISETGARLLQSKIPDFKLSEPIETTLYHKLINARNDFLALQGAKNILSSFSVSWKSEYDKLQDNFLQSLNKYKADLNAEQETILDLVLFYERSKPYPLNDQGFLFDVGSIGKTWFKLSDEDFKQRNELKDGDPPKYELVEQMICLSKFLQSKDMEAVWSPFISYYEENKVLHKLNDELSLSDDLPLNNILTIAFYLKFRDLIRNTRLLEEKPFTDVIMRHLTKVPEETIVALLLNGLFFGALKFKELHYKYNLLKIVKRKFIPQTNILHTTSKISAKEFLLKKSNASLKSDHVKEGNIEKVVSLDNAKNLFDKALWQLLEPFLEKYGNDQVNKIRKVFDKIVKKDGELFREKRFIETLRNAKTKGNKTSMETIDEIEVHLNRLLGL